MNIAMAGIDHRRASLQLRERFAFTKAEAAEALARLAEQYLLCQTEGGFQALDFLKSL